MIKKGSVAVDGISLTINNCDGNSFDVNVIPHTAKMTTLGFCKIGDFVNIETDMIGKYVERFVAGRPYTEIEEKTKTTVDMQFLEKTGFIR
jgi:riboflavin synthase